MNQTIEVDVVIIGGGLQGLCTLKELIQRGYTAVLLSAGELGGEQTAHSHAFLHEGHMFRRSDNIRHTQSSYRCWESYLADSESKTWEGDFYYGDIDPADFRKHCAAWGNDIASLQPADDCQPPTGFNSDMKFWQGRGTCLNTRWVVDQIGTQHTEQIAFVEGLRLVTADETAVVVEAQNPRGEVLRIQARTLVAAAGVGNHRLLAGWPACPMRQQTIKTHMLLVRSPALEPIAGMFRPVLSKRNALFIAPRTIQGTNVWLISDGTRNVIEYANENKYDWPQSETSDWLKQMIDSLTQLCTNHFRPEMRDHLEWSVYKAPKAESEQPVLGRMPEGPEYYFVDAMRTCVVWPTLLTHIPRASHEISENVTWFGPPAAGLRGDALTKWLKWRSQPGCAVELWRKVPFLSWREFSERYLMQSSNP